MGLDLRGKLSLDGSGWERTLRQAGDSVDHLTQKISGGLKGQLAAAFSVGAMAEVIRRTVEYGTNIAELSVRLGISTNAVQVWDQVLKRNGSTVDSAAGFFEKMAAARQKALSGGEDAEKFIDAFSRFGISVSDLQTDRIEDLAEKVSQVFANGGDPQKLVDALRDIGGRSAGEMIPALASGIKEAAANAKATGTIIDGDIIQKLKEAGDRATELGVRFTSWIAPWVAGMTEGFQVITDGIESLFKGLAANFQNGILDAFRNPESGRKRFFEALFASNEAHQNRDKATAAAQNRRERQHPVGGIDDSTSSGETSKEEKLSKDMDALRDEIKETELAKLHTLDKEVKLRKEINELLGSAAYIEQEAGGATDASIKLRRRANKNQHELNELLKAAEPKIQTDSLNKVGNFLGQNASGISTIQDRVIQAHKDNTSGVVKLTGSVDALTAKLELMIANINAGGDGSGGFPP